MPTVTMQIWELIVIIIGVLLLTAVITFFVTRKILQDQIKKNPPVNEAMIRAMMTQMGRTPSEKQVRAVMKSMDVAKEESKAKKKKAK